jgi:ATP-binding protein involved in chromosome partitioning
MGRWATSTTIELPLAITRRDDGVVIEWTSADRPVVLPARWLRLACPCAQCVEEMSRRPILDPATVPIDVRPVHLALVGAYGLRVQWSDGHNTGIYPFAWLKAQTGPPPSIP